jgi:hypothetical protein
MFGPSQRTAAFRRKSMPLHDEHLPNPRRYAKKRKRRNQRRGLHRISSGRHWLNNREVVVRRVRTMPIEAVGGYTEADAIGAWRDYDGQIIHDHSNVFTVSELSSRDLEQIVDYVLRNHEAVYVREPDGTSGLFSRPRSREEVVA